MLRGFASGASSAYPRPMHKQNSYPSLKPSFSM